MRKRKFSWKKLLIWVLILALLAGGGVGWYYYGHTNADPVFVYEFQFVGMTEYWGDTRESYGPVTTDRIQTVFLSDTQSVSELLVAEGDSVKKGDLLMRFDTTLSDLAVERKGLEVEKLRLQLEDAQTRLNQINGMRPMVVPQVTESQPNEGSSLSGDYSISKQLSHDGSSRDKAMICWLADSADVTDDLLETILYRSEKLRNAKIEKEFEEGERDDCEYVSVSSCYVIFKVTQGNMSLGNRVIWQGAFVKRTDIDYRIKFFNANSMSDFTVIDEQEEEDAPEVDYGSGFTAYQISQMRLEQQKTIKDLEFKLKMSEAEFRIMEAELNDGGVYAEVDGKVVSVLDEEEAKMTQQPVLKVSGGGGYFVEGTVSELERDSLKIGQEVSISDWQSGMVYPGTVTEIRDFPSGQSGFYGAGNPNATQYPFVAFVEGDADLREGSYVSVSYTPQETQNGIYLQKPFLRTEQGRSFVYVMGQDGLLEERTVKTGKSLWGSYTEILEGLTTEDLIAFPYGKNVKPGAKAVQGDLGDLYSY